MRNSSAISTEAERGTLERLLRRMVEQGRMTVMPID